MKKTIITVTIVVAAFVLGALFGASKASLFNTSAAMAAPTPAPMAAPVPEGCPTIHEAIRSLYQAHDGELNQARHDFCGHKQAAMRAIDAAINELKAAESCARCRER